MLKASLHQRLVRPVGLMNMGVTALVFMRLLIGKTPSEGDSWFYPFVALYAVTALAAATVLVRGMRLWGELSLQGRSVVVIAGALIVLGFMKPYFTNWPN